MRAIYKLSLIAAIATAGISGEIEKQDKSVNLGEITVVSATGYRQNIQDAPASISVLTQKEIQKRNYQDISAMVEDLPSAFTATLGAASRKGISLRGLSQKYTKILIDGKPATSDSAYKGLRSIGSSQNFLPPANAIERIEVIRGPMSSLYGSDAMGGVINIITKGFSNELSGNVNGYYTFAKKSQIKGDYQTGFYLNGAIVPDVLGIALYGRFFEKIEDKEPYANRNNEETNMGAKLMYNVTQNDEVALDYRKVNNKFRRTYGRTRTTSGGNNDIAKEDMKGYTASLSHQGKYDKFMIDSYANYDSMKESGAQDLRLRTTTLNSKGSYFFDSNALSLGVQYRSERLNEAATTADEANVKRWDYSIYGEDDFYLTDDLTLTGGIRYNRDKDYGGHISPRAYAVYRLNESFSIKGGVSTGYSTPDIKQRSEGLALPFAGGQGAQIGRSSLKPESSISYEGGFSYDDNDKFNFSATAFYTEIKDGISTKLICRPRPGNPCVHNGKTYRRGIWDTINVGEAEVRGLELSSDYQILDNLKLHANYAYTKSEQKTGSEKGKTLNNFPIHSVKLGFDYDVSSKLNLWSQINYYSRTRDSLSYDEDIRSYTLFDLGASYKVTKDASLNFTLYNIFNEFVLTRSGNYQMMVVDGMKAQVGFNVNF